MAPLSGVGLVAACTTCPCVVSASRRPSSTRGRRIAPCGGTRGCTAISRARTRGARGQFLEPPASLPTLFPPRHAA